MSNTFILINSVLILAFVIPLLCFEVLFWLAVAYLYFQPYLPLVKL